MLTKFRRRLSWKLFVSYLSIILVGTVVLATTVEFSIPGAFERHMAGMTDAGAMGGMMEQEMGEGLYASFQAAAIEALARAALAAFAAAVVVSLFISRQVVAPIQEMRKVTQQIAAGSYEQRVQVTGDPAQVDELGQLAISFNRMAEKLARTESMRRRLIADVSHELRTPLTTIKGSMEGLMDGVLPPELETYQGIYHEADRLQRLVADLQELSRVEAGAVPLKFEKIALGPIINGVTQRLKPQFESKGVALHAQSSPDLPPVYADADRLTQVLINLTGNALQYTPSGGTVEVLCSERRDPAADASTVLQIAIKDSGIGVPAEHLPHLFDRFYRVDKSRSRAGGGSGIGLTISRHIVEAHGGRIWVESEGAGKGSTFVFTLPAASRQEKDG